VAATAALHLSRACWFAGDPAAARDAAEWGLTALGDLEDPLVAKLSVELAHQRVRTEEVAGSTTEVARAALEVAERLDTEVPRARNVLATALAHDGRPGWEEAFRAVIPEAAAAGDTETECSAAYFLASHLGFAGRLPEAIQLLEVMIERAGELGELTWRDHMISASITDRFMVGGDPGRLVEDANRFVHDRPLFRNRAQAELALALSLGDLARFDEARAALECATVALTSDEDRSILLAAGAEVAWMQGDVDRTIELAGEAVTLGPGWFGITAGTVATAALARFERAEPVTDVIAPVKVPIFASFVSEVDALRAVTVGDSARAIALLDGVQALPGVLRRYLVRAQWTAAVIAARSADPTARCRFEKVAQEATEAGIVPLQTRAAAALRAMDRPALLTERETAVLELVGEGLTSNEIADRLGIARPTVESHIGAAMRKLGARTRRQAALMIR
jgi:DNA-binding CsgD family transcriptional regulator/tetratricopeptide (TPR) repeat protein